MREYAIIETGSEAKKREEREKIKCPDRNCQSSRVLGSYHIEYESQGMFRYRKPVKVKTLRCIDCGCRFEVRES